MCPILWRTTGQVVCGAGIALIDCKLNLADGMFDDEALQLALRDRRESERELRAFLNGIRDKQKSLQREFHQARSYTNRALTLSRVMDLQAESSREIEHLMYPGVQLGVRKQFLSFFGSTGWSENALASIKKHSRCGVIELGAGCGQWSNALRMRGVNVMAVDNFSELPDHTLAGVERARQNGVIEGNEEILKNKPRTNQRTLLLVFPPPDGFAKRALDLYRGKTLIYVGEGRGGVNATNPFFDELELSGDWNLLETQDVVQFPGGYEKMYVFQRNR